MPWEPELFCPPLFPPHSLISWKPVHQCEQVIINTHYVAATKSLVLCIGPAEFLRSILLLCLYIAQGTTEEAFSSLAEITLFFLIGLETLQYFLSGSRAPHFCSGDSFLGAGLEFCNSMFCRTCIQMFCIQPSCSVSSGSEFNLGANIPSLSWAR